MERLVGEWIPLKWVLKDLWQVLTEDVPLIFHYWRIHRPFVKCGTCQTEWISQEELRRYKECHLCWNRNGRVLEH